MLQISKNGPEQMADNPKPGQRQEYVARGGEYRPAPAPTADPRVILARGIVALGLLLVVVLIYFIWRIPTCWSDPCATIRAVEPIAFAALLCGLPAVAVAVLGFAWLGRQRTQRALERAEVARTALTLDRFGNPVSSLALTALAPEQHMELYWKALVLATEAKIRTAPYEQLPAGLNSLNQAPAVPAQLIAAENAPPAIDVGPLAPEQWLAWLDEQPHALFGGMTGSGKSTVTKAALTPRLNAGESVLIIDPHSSDWFGLPGVGGGEDWPAVEAAMMAVYAEYKNRLAYRDRYKRETDEELASDYFPRLTVLFDEANNACSAFERLYSGKDRRNDPWPLFAECLGSGARKVAISVWLLAQSVLVDDIRLSGGMRANFTRIALDSATIAQMIRDEGMPERKEALKTALAGLDYPATANMKNRVYLIDRTGLDRAPRPRQRTPWAGWDYAANRAIVTLDDDGTVPGRPLPSVRPDMALRASVALPAAPADGRTADGRVYHQDRIRLYLVALARQGKSREYARAWAEAHGLRFENSLWTEVRKELGLG